MRHNQFFEENPHARVAYFAKWTRQQLSDVGEEPWRLLRRINSSGDKLAFRAYILQREGAQTLINVIMGDHNRPNRY